MLTGAEAEHKAGREPGGPGATITPSCRAFDVQRFSVHDGPGIRTTVFLEGCPLRCAWCHNPEGFGSDRTHAVSVETILNEVLKDQDYYASSGGGLTVSGGEPLLHLKSVVALLKAAKRHGLHTCVQTSGSVPSKHLAAVLELVDLFHFDLKHMDPTRHEELTGVSNERILRNAAFLVEQKANVHFRMPLIPGINDDVTNLNAVASFLCGLYPPGARALRLVPYQGMYLGKYAALGLVPPMPSLESPSPSALLEVVEYLSGLGLSVEVDG